MHSQSRTEETRGRGNCAFHAFALGLFTPSVITQLNMNARESGSDLTQVYGEFIYMVNQKLNLEHNWEIVSGALLEMRTVDPIKFQKLLGPILRKLAIRKILESDITNPKQEPQIFLSAFHDFLYHFSNVTVTVPDDIFLDDSTVLAKFLNIYQALQDERFNFLKNKTPRTPQETAELKNILEQFFMDKKNELSKWWYEIGYRAFMKDMETTVQLADGEFARSAGDKELAPLAQFFGVNLDVQREAFKLCLHSANGKFPAGSFTQEEKDQLFIRGIANRTFLPYEDLTLLPLTRDELIARLDAVPNVDEIIEIITSTEGERLDCRYLPENLSTSVTQLRSRNMLNSFNQFERISKESAFARVIAFTQELKEKILQLWDAHYVDAPKLTLSHANNHWENVLEDTPDFSMVDQPTGASSAFTTTTTATPSTASTTTTATPSTVSTTTSSSVSPSSSTSTTNSTELHTTVDEVPVIPHAEPSATPSTTMAHQNERNDQTSERKRVIDLYTSKQQQQKAQVSYQEEAHTQLLLAAITLSQQLATSGEAPQSDLITYSIFSPDRDGRPLLQLNPIAEGRINEALQRAQAPVKVDKGTQEKLDEQLAKKLQREEYQAYMNERRNRRR